MFFNIPRKKISLFKRHDEIILCQDHVEQLLDSVDTDMFCTGSKDINLSQWRFDLIGDYPNGIEECFRHRKASNTLWLDGHISEIEESTGEDVRNKWYDPSRED